MKSRRQTGELVQSTESCQSQRMLGCCLGEDNVVEAAMMMTMLLLPLMMILLSAAGLWGKRWDTSRQVALAFPWFYFSDGERLCLRRCCGLANPIGALKEDIPDRIGCCEDRCGAEGRKWAANDPWRDEVATGEIGQ